MKYLKMLGLAAVAAMALMAFVGAGSASATVLCKTAPVGGVCPEGWDYAAGTEGTASLTESLVLETKEGTILDTCSGSTVQSTLSNTGSAAETIKSKLSSITFTGCTKTTDTINPGSGEVHWIAGTSNGTLTTFSTEVTVNTIFGSCVYGAKATGTDYGTTVGGNPGSLTLNTLIPRVSGNFACPAEARITGKYVATNPTNAWVAER